MATKFIGDDFVELHAEANSNSKVKIQIAFGDRVEVGEECDGWIWLRAMTVDDGSCGGWAENRPVLNLRDEGILKFSMVDVQQGDGLVLETRSGKLVLFDGGDNKLFARHVAARFHHRKTAVDTPLDVEAIIITHGDADHFYGLNDILRSETKSGIEERKRIFLRPKRIYHNGLIKLPGSKPDGSKRPRLEMLGEMRVKDDVRYAVDLVDDPTSLPEERLNRPFRTWVKTVKTWRARSSIAIKRIAFGDDESELFDFLEAEGVKVALQGPFPEDVDGRPGLRFFRQPKRDAELHLESAEGAYSASETINGHSISMLITYGAVRLNLTGDLNRPAMRLALENLDKSELEAEILKTPHHGSGDFDFEALAAIKPVVAIISSGDESASKEHVHPRATLMAALGKVMRLDTGVIFNTELAAFFSKRGYAHKREVLSKYFRHETRRDKKYTGKEVAKFFAGRVDKGDPKPFYGFERTNWGIIHIRTDGERVLVFTHSGKKFLNEAYAFIVKLNDDGSRSIDFADKVVKR